LSFIFKIDAYAEKAKFLNCTDEVYAVPVGIAFDNVLASVA
jgi:hypothetical protein